MFSSNSKFMAIFICFFLFALSTSLNAQEVPALYMFGDSLVDVGNNNYIKLSILKADYPHYGIDYSDGTATGRFSNGKNSADFIAEKLGLPTSPPYLSNQDDVFLQGVSFASAGSGLFNSTGQGFLQKCIPLTQQVEYYSTVYARQVQYLGADDAQQHLSKSIFAIVTGSNDLLGYFDNDQEITGQEYIDQLISIFQDLLKGLYNLGGRKFVVSGMGALGCTPQRRRTSDNEECVAEVNELAVKYNQGLQTMLQGLEAELSGIHFSFLDIYNALTELINNPTEYGFAEVNAACCGLGKLNAVGFCTPVSVYCSNRSDHVFWDQLHPTEAADNILIDIVFKGSNPLVTPLNLDKLIAL